MSGTDHRGEIVAATDLHRRYGEGEAAVEALDGITVSFPEQRFAAIMGPSGSGKSTLMHMLAGLDRPTSGSVRIAGVELTELDDRELTQLRRDRDRLHLPDLQPAAGARRRREHPAAAVDRRARRRPGVVRHARARRSASRDRLTHRPAELSGGQQQRVAVARALVSRPSVVFADEPSGNLDSKASDDVLRLLRQAVDDFEQTVVMVTHDAHAASFADRLLVLADGRIVHDGEAVSTEQTLDLMKALG